LFQSAEKLAGSTLFEGGPDRPMTISASIVESTDTTIDFFWPDRSIYVTIREATGDLCLLAFLPPLNGMIYAISFNDSPARS
jgi:hypothetical protein